MRRASWMAALGLLSAAPAVHAAADLEPVMLRLHNAERARVGTPPLAWDERLAAEAAAYARHLAERRRGLAHSSPRSRDGQGENLWMGTAGFYPPAAMFGSWAQERRFFRQGLFPDVGRGVAWPAVGHYTQIVWSTTERVGCGLHRAGGWDYLVCRYSPAGNILGRPVF